MKTMAYLLKSITWLSVVISCRAFYVSYEDPKEYEFGDKVEVLADKLTSPETLSSMDYNNLATCWSDENRRLKRSNLWSKSIDALHGDAYWVDHTFDIRFGQDLYCQPRCRVSLENEKIDSINLPMEALTSFEFHYWIDDMPTALRLEDDETRTINYWAGVPFGTITEEQFEINSRYQNFEPGSSFIHNHLNFEIQYYKKDNGKHRILRTTIEPHSIHTGWTDPLPRIPSCQASSAAPRHTSYDMLYDLQPQSATGDIQFTYDVIWVEVDADDKDYKNRWEIFLTMDNAQPAVVKFLSIFVAMLINFILLGALATWTLRDLSYKPILTQMGLEGDDDEDIISPDAMEDLRIWPLSTRLFFPPKSSELVLCVACGTGAHILSTGFVFVVLFRLGLINQSLWADVLSAFAVLFVVCSYFGGYVAGRLSAIFHQTQSEALKSSFYTAAIYPMCGLIITCICYDGLQPPYAPYYGVARHSTPLFLIWILCVIPLSLFGGWRGFWDGPISDFPVSRGSMGFHDLDLQKESVDVISQDVHSRCGNWYIFLVLSVGGILPVLGAFIAYAYGVAGPIFAGYFTDNHSFMIASYSLFFFSAASVSLLIYYSQLRAQNYDWWWSIFSAGASSGVYLFLLSMTWLAFNGSLEHVYGSTWALYVLWFAYTSTAVVLAAGFVGVTTCIIFTRVLYAFVKQRGQEI